MVLLSFHGMEFDPKLLFEEIIDKILTTDTATGIATKIKGGQRSSIYSTTSVKNCENFNSSGVVLDFNCNGRGEFCSNKHKMVFPLLTRKALDRNYLFISKTETHFYICIIVIIVGGDKHNNRKENTSSKKTGLIVGVVIAVVLVVIALIGVLLFFYARFVAMVSNAHS